MADSLKQAKEFEAEILPPAPRDGGRLGLRGERMLALVAALLLAATLFLGWRAYFFEEEGDPVASAMQTFEKQNDLIVLTYRFQVVAESVIRGPLDVSLLERRQIIIIPTTVEYRVELDEVEAADMEWDAEDQLLRVTLPKLRTSRPNLDEANARAFTNGLWVTREDARELARKNSEIAERKAIEYAKEREILDVARTAAREAVRQNLAVPLQVAGYERARVEIRFADE
ncbi:MAG: DUF4230 domain-containing protein [Erythrobacter sp.]|nr:DUF4230 domain-containing protein [Erythrobacter sp.]